MSFAGGAGGSGPLSGGYAPVTYQWTSFELLSEALKLHPVMLSRALRFLEQGHMLRRYERRESRRKKRNLVGEALERLMRLAARAFYSGPCPPPGRDLEPFSNKSKIAKVGLLTEYFTLDYARAFDALQALERELAPLTRLMADIQARAVPLPDPGELFEWAQRVSLADGANPVAPGGSAAAPMDVDAGDVEWEDV
eukprot:XP_001697333.1 predicted protein [Chlamydomonas reinhardtii]